MDHGPCALLKNSQSLNLNRIVFKGRHVKYSYDAYGRGEDWAKGWSTNQMRVRPLFATY
jgi:hypothetical protein